VNFSDCIAKERDDEFGEKTCWRLEVTPAPEKLILHSWKIDDGKEKYPWFYSVLASDLDPQSIIIEEPLEEGDLYSLKMNCIFYKDAIVEKRLFDPSFLRQSVVLYCPLAKEISNVESAKKSLQDFLFKCGARPPQINSEAIEDLLAPLRAALEPARWPIKWSKDKRPTTKQTVEIESQRMLLIRKMERIKSVPYYKIPFKFWSLRKYLFPTIEQDTFELLSLDTTKNDVRKVPDEPGVWMTSLYSVERLNTRLVSKIPPTKGYRLWYADVLFSTEAEANCFSKTCARSIEQIRERLYKLHSVGA
jgi:hypothetical protein